MFDSHRSSALLLCTLTAACSVGEDSSDSAQSPGATFGSESANDFAGTPGGATPAPQQPGGSISADGTPVTPLPMEIELNLEFELPQAGERYVYAASTQNDSVAVIDASTLAIQSVEAGDQPTFLRTLGQKDAAIVLNVGSSDATIVRTENGASSAVNVDVQEGANAIAVSPDGKHAVVYYDAAYRGSGITGSFQDISVLFLEEGDEESVDMTVGFRPSAVSFSEDGRRAFVVTEDGVSLLDFREISDRGAHIAETVALGSDATASLDVSVTPDGAYALARREGESQLRLADLQTGEIHLLDLAEALPMPEPEAPEPAPEEDAPQAVEDAGATDSDAGDAGGSSPPPAAPPATTAAPAPAPPLPIPAAITDVDLAPSGDFALAVVRDQSTVLKVQVPGSFISNQDVEAFRIDDELVGSVSISPQSDQALLYTTVVDTDERMSILDIDSGEFSIVSLPKAVERVTISPDGETALVIHRKLAGDPNEVGIDPDMVIDRSYGYSVLELGSGFSKLQLAQTSVGPSTVVPGGSDLFVLFSNPSLNLKEVHHVKLESFLVERIQLGSPPNSIGSVPGSQKVFVGQEHPDGRIAFIDWESGELESVTGFELNSRIRE